MPLIPDQDFSSLFEPPPAQWGLRGDPYLWEAMRAALRGQALPASAEALEASIAERYLGLTGQALDLPDRLHVPAFAHGGMSSGMISPREGPADPACGSEAARPGRERRSRRRTSASLDGSTPATRLPRLIPGAAENALPAARDTRRSP
ncbi:hypothetical protein ACS0X5_33980 [Burkholderia gladioli]|uniref:hypothetical protein n=1 Tax=Burkholderia gladioli TaxID=28095 RepID=UPI003B986AAC